MHCGRLGWVLDTEIHKLVQLSIPEYQGGNLLLTVYIFFRARVIFLGEIADKTKNSEARSTSALGMESHSLSAVRSHTNALHLSSEYDE